MKTKFIKVKAIDRMPKNQGMYMVVFKNNKVGKFNYWDEEAFKDSWLEHVDYWLEEVPDREEEMRGMLEKARTVIAIMKRSILVHPDHEEGSEFDDLTTYAQDVENEIEQLLKL